MDDREKFRLTMDGEWDLDDMRNLTDSVRMGYSYFYWMLQDPQTMDSSVKAGIARHFWSGGYVPERFAQTLYDQIPTKHHLKIVSIRFESPGWIELAGYLPVFLAFGYVTKVWIKTFDEAFDLFRKVDRYFDERKLRKIEQRAKLVDINGQFVDEARTLCFQYGKHLGLDQNKIESLIELNGNPIGALRLLVTVSAEARKLHDLQKQGKINFPIV